MIMFIIGVLAGIISGMGFGGGTLLIPSLVLFTDIQQQQAQGVNLIVFIPVSLLAIYIHYKEKTIDFKVSKWIIISGIFGSIAGSLLAIKINPHTLKVFFASFLLIIGLIGLFKK